MKVAGKNSADGGTVLVHPKAEDGKKPGRFPDFSASVKVDGKWVDIGAAWSIENERGGYSVRLKPENFPKGWDGSFALFPATRRY